MNTFYSTPEIQIGKHRWRCIVEAHPSYGAVTNYQWFDDRLDFWRDSTRWPFYDPHDSYEGLPKTLRDLYLVHQRPLLEALIAGQEQWLNTHLHAPEYERVRIEILLQGNRTALQLIPSVRN